MLVGRESFCQQGGGSFLVEKGYGFWFVSLIRRSGSCTTCRRKVVSPSLHVVWQRLCNQSGRVNQSGPVLQPGSPDVTKKLTLRLYVVLIVFIFRPSSSFPRRFLANVSVPRQRVCACGAVFSEKPEGKGEVQLEDARHRER